METNGNNHPDNDFIPISFAVCYTTDFVTHVNKLASNDPPLVHCNIWCFFERTSL